MKDTPVILVVDHNRRNLEVLSGFIGRGGYQTRTAAGLEEFDQALWRKQTRSLWRWSISRVSTVTSGSAVRPCAHQNSLPRLIAAAERRDPTSEPHPRRPWESWSSRSR